MSAGRHADAQRPPAAPLREGRGGDGEGGRQDGRHEKVTQAHVVSRCFDWPGI
jgi:hypothetical protein